MSRIFASFLLLTAGLVFASPKLSWVFYLLAAGGVLSSATSLVLPFPLPLAFGFGRSILEGAGVMGTSGAGCLLPSFARFSAKSSSSRILNIMASAHWAGSSLE